MSDLIDVLSKFSVHDLARMLAERIEADSQSTFKNRHDLGGGITLFKQKAAPDGTVESINQQMAFMTIVRAHGNSTYEMQRPKHIK